MSKYGQQSEFRENRRRHILDAAETCMRVAGFHGAGMAQIAKTAELSVGQIYRYFENKEAIIAALAAEDRDRMRAHVAELEDQESLTPEAFVEALTQSIGKFYDPVNAPLILEVLAEAARNPAIAEIVSQAELARCDVAIRLIRRAAPDLSEAEAIARADVLAMLFDGMVTHSINADATNRDRTAQILATLVRTLITMPQPSKAQ